MYLWLSPWSTVGQIRWHWARRPQSHFRGRNWVKVKAEMLLEPTGSGSQGRLCHTSRTWAFSVPLPLQSRHDLQLAVLSITAARQERTVPSHFGPFSQSRGSAPRFAASSSPGVTQPFHSFLATRLGCHFACAMDSSFTAVECSTRGCPSKEWDGCFDTITPSHSCPGSTTVGGPGQGPTSAAVVRNSVFPGEDGCFSSELGLWVGKRSHRPLCKGGKKITLSSASSKSPLLQAQGVERFFYPLLLFSRARGGAGPCKRSLLT